MNEAILHVFQEIMGEEMSNIISLTQLPDDGAHRAYEVIADDGRYILERARRSVIYDPEAEINNIDRMHAHLAGCEQRRVVVAFPEERRHMGAQGLWRLFASAPAETPLSPEALGTALGAWHAAFDGFDADAFVSTYADSLDASKLFDGLLRASTSDPTGRLEEAVSELDKLMGAKGEVLSMPVGRRRLLPFASGLRDPMVVKEDMGMRVVVDPTGVLKGQLWRDFGAACLRMRSKDELEAFCDAFLMRTAPLLGANEADALPLAPRAVALCEAAKHLTNLLTGHSKGGEDALDMARQALRSADRSKENAEEIHSVINIHMHRYL